MKLKSVPSRSGCCISENTLYCPGDGDRVEYTYDVFWLYLRVLLVVIVLYGRQMLLWALHGSCGDAMTDGLLPIEDREESQW
jgi:hypothetical protein